MKKSVFSVLILSVLFLSIPNIVFAHPGRTDSSGCHKCRTNCAKWGLEQEEYHCHSGNRYTNSRGQVFNSDGSMINNSSSSNNSSTNNNSSSVPKESPKSNDNNLKSITIDGENIEIFEQMTYKTKKENIDISVETNDSKATYHIDNHSLQVGKNDIHIQVTAENGDVKNYNLSVDREKLSSNTNIKVFVDDQEIKFISEKANVDISSDTKNLNYRYELEDSKSQVKVEGNQNLKSGENIVTFTVTAEDGTERKYELTVNQLTKGDETTDTILGLVTIGGIGYGIYYFSKKRKKNKLL